MAGAFRAVTGTIGHAALACVLLLAFDLGATAQGVESHPAPAAPAPHAPVPAAQKGASPAPRVSRPPTQETEHSKLLRNVDRTLDDIQRMIADAYFTTALGVVDSKREWLDELGPLPGLAPRRARLEVLAATAQVALERRTQALASMRRALQADPSLSLEESRTPPKIYALLREARRSRLSRSSP